MGEEKKDEHVMLSASVEEVEQKLAALAAERKVLEKEYQQVKQKISATDREGLELGSKISRLVEREKLLREEKKAMKRQLRKVNEEMKKFEAAEKKLKG